MNKTMNKACYNCGHLQESHVTTMSGLTVCYHFHRDKSKCFCRIEPSDKRTEEDE